MEANNSVVLDLCERLSGRPSKEVTLTLAREVQDNTQLLDALLEIVYGETDPLRWRAAWVLEKVSGQCPSLLVRERSKISKIVPQASLPNGLRRLLLGVLYNLPETKDVDVALLNYLLDTMCSLQEPSGVQALAMKLAFRMCRTDLDLYGEFCTIVQEMDMEYYSAGVKAVARNCLSKTKKRG